jgi:hypothetical protein
MNVTVTGSLPTTDTTGAAQPPSDTASINIYRATGSAAPVLLGTATISGAGFSYVDASPAPGSYQYGATAVEADGVESAVSNLFPVVVPPAQAAALSPPTITNAVAA